MLRLIAIASLLSTIFISSGVTEEAHAYSNSSSITIGSARVNVEDVALCTKFNYNFDSALSEWAITGYQTCASEALTVDSLPATLQFKIRLQSINPSEFLASTMEAFLTDTSGNRISTSRWPASPLFNVDGNFNPQDGIFYGAFGIRNSQTFPAGTYTLSVQFTNAQWTKLNGTANEVPSTTNVFSFTINPGKLVSSTTKDPSGTSAPSCTVDPVYSVSAARSEKIIETLMSKTKELSDLAMPGARENLLNYQKIIKGEIDTLTLLRAKAEASYGGNTDCSEFLKVRDYLASVSRNAVGTLETIELSLKKVESLSNQKKTPDSSNSDAMCELQGTSILSSVKNSRVVFAQYLEKSRAPFDVNSANAMLSVRMWSSAVDDEYRNILTWEDKLPEYRKQMPDCQDFLVAKDWIADAKNEYRELSAFISGLKTKISAVVSKQNTPEQQLADDDGIEEDPAANLTVTFSTTISRYIIKVESNLPDDSLTIRATKKGAKPLRFTISTDEEGLGGLRTKTKLSGYTLTLYYDALKLDSVKVK